MPSAIDEHIEAGIGSEHEAVLRVDPLDDPSWDTNVSLHPSATSFHTSAWASVLNKSFGFKPCYFVIEHRDGRRSVLPLMEVDSWLTGRRGVSLPFTDECTPLVRDSGAFTALYDCAVRFGKSRRWSHLELRGGTSLLHETTPSTRFLGHKLDLTSNSLFANVVGSVRQAVRKAARSGLIVENCTGIRPIGEFYALMCKTRHRHGMPPQPFRFFKAIDEQIISAGKGLLFLARHRGRAVAGAIFLVTGRHAIFKFGASDSSLQGMRPNNLVMWEAITHLVQNRIESLDMGRTSIGNEGLRKFKLSWGAQERLVEYVRLDLKTNSFVNARDMSTGSHCRIFRTLPMPISRAIGSVLYKHAA